MRPWLVGLRWCRLILLGCVHLGLRRTCCVEKFAGYNTEEKGKSIVVDLQQVKVMCDTDY
jgi:hypothetical protein